MTYITHKERRALIYVGAALVTALICLGTLASLTASPCRASAEVCAFAIR